MFYNLYFHFTKSPLHSFSSYSKTNFENFHEDVRPSTINLWNNETKLLYIIQRQ